MPFARFSPGARITHAHAFALDDQRAAAHLPKNSASRTSGGHFFDRASLPRRSVQRSRPRWSAVVEVRNTGKAELARMENDGLHLGKRWQILTSGKGFSVTTPVPACPVLVLLVVTGCFFVFPTVAQQVPDRLHPPSNEKLLQHVHAKGNQIYACKADGEQFTWTLKAPEAQLDGKPFGRHFAEPSWQANDGSRVTGKAAASVPSPDLALSPGYSSLSWATAEKASLRVSRRFSASTPRVEKHLRPAATLRISTGSCACPIPPTISSSRQNKTEFPQSAATSI
jgi:hypothetical protein